MTNLAHALHLTQETLWLHVVVFLRVGPIVALFPGFGEETVPLRIKLSLALAFTAVVAPMVAEGTGAGPGNWPVFPYIILSETVIGLSLGIGVRFFLMALQTAGSIAAQSTSLSQILGNSGITPMPAMGHVLVTGAVALAMIMDVHVRLAEMAILSYEVLPVGRLPEPGILSGWGVKQVAHSFEFAFVLAAPFVIISFLYNLMLGIINRAMPQLMVVLVGAPAITAGGLLLLMLLAAPMLTLWVTALQDFIEAPFGGG